MNSKIMQYDLVWKILSSWIIVLQFDGSFRPPKDPGYPTVRAKLATCAACSFFEPSDKDNQCDPVAIALGSRVLPLEMDMTSAHAEYGGLLLGLEWISENPALVQLPSSSDMHQSLVIQGDCKTVIDQLSGKSTSRKLEKEHEHALRLFSKILPHFGTIDFVHIPRSRNALCDNLCSNTMLSLESFAYQQCCNELDGASLNIDSLTSLESTFQQHIKSDTSLIRHSLRPFLLATMLRLAEESKDYKSMTKIGQYIFDEAKQFTIEKDAEKHWRANGVANQITGLRGMGQEKKAAALERKHRVLLSSHGKNGMKNFASLAEKPTLAWDSTIDQFWNPLLEDWSKYATQETSWTKERKGSTVWSQSNSQMTISLE